MAAVAAPIPLPKIVKDPNAPPETKAQRRKRREREKGMVLRRSMLNFQNTGVQSRNQLQVLWSQANECPMWKQMRERKKDKETGQLLPYPLKKDKKTGKQVPNKIRSNRVLSKGTINTMLSGAAAAVGNKMHEEARALRCDVAPEDPRFPVQPSCGVGPHMSLDKRWTAYIQEIFRTAVDMKNAVGMHKKVSTEGMMIAAELVNKRIAEGTGFMPPTVTIRQKKRKVATKKAKEDAYAPKATKPAD